MIRGFNGIRGIAVLMVLVTHFRLSDYSIFNIDVSSISSGTTGVYMFFCLSGFLITYILLKEYDHTGTISIKSFLIRRMLRLLPAMLSYCSVLAILMVFGYVQSNWPSIIYALSYTTNFSLKKHYSDLLYHFWSLSVEEHFYIFYPLIFKLNSKMRVLLILVLLIGISMIVKILQVNYFLYVKQLTENYRWTIPAILPILTGAIMSILLYYTKSKEWLIKNNWILLLSGLILFANEVIFNNYFMMKFGLNYLFQSVGVAFILTYIFLKQKSILVSILEFKPLAFVGKISYGLYIWHVLFSHIVFYNGLNLIAGFVLSFVVAVISFYTIEAYFLRKKISFSPAH